MDFYFSIKLQNFEGNIFCPQVLDTHIGVYNIGVYIIDIYRVVEYNGIVNLQRVVA